MALHSYSSNISITIPGNISLSGTMFVITAISEDVILYEFYKEYKHGIYETVSFELTDQKIYKPNLDYGYYYSQFQFILIRVNIGREISLLTKGSYYMNIRRMILYLMKKGERI